MTTTNLMNIGLTLFQHQLLSTYRFNGFQGEKLGTPFLRTIYFPRTFSFSSKDICLKEGGISEVHRMILSFLKCIHTVGELKDLTLHRAYGVKLL